jgi:hypothetical protein
VILGGMIFTACGSGGGSPAEAGAAGASAPLSPAQPSGSPSPSPTSPADIARRDAVAAYLGMWKSYAQASHTADWKAPYLSRYASGEALQVLTGSLYADRLNGVVAKGEPVNNPRVTSASPEAVPTTVMVSDCSDSRNWLRYRTDGSLLDSTPGGMRRIAAEVKKRTDGLWRVTRFGVGELGSC